jgi:chemotaxis protein MotD
MTQTDFSPGRVVPPAAGQAKPSRPADRAGPAPSDKGDFHKVMAKFVAQSRKEREPVAAKGEAQENAPAPQEHSRVQAKAGEDAGPGAPPEDGGDPGDGSHSASALLDLLDGAQKAPAGPALPPAGAGAQLAAGAAAMMAARSAGTSSEGRPVAGQDDGAQLQDVALPAPGGAQAPPARPAWLGDPQPGGLAAKVAVIGQETHLRVAGRQPLAAPLDKEGEPQEQKQADGSAMPVPAKPGAAERAAGLPVLGADTRDGGKAAAREWAGSHPGLANAAQPEVSGSDQFGMLQPVAAPAGKDGQPASQAPGPVLEQIAGRIIDLAAAEIDDASPAPGAASTAKSTSAGMVKVLTIHLQPPELGTVAVRMSLNNDGLELQLEVGRAETARLLQRDRDRLSDVLRSAGYQVDGVAVRVVERDAITATGQAANGMLDNSTQSQAGSSQPDGRTSGGRGQPGHGLNPHPAMRNGRDEDRRDQSRTGGDIYV